MMGMNSDKTRKQGTSVTGKRDQQCEKGKCSAFTTGRKKIKIKKERQGRALIKDTVWMQENTQRSPPPLPSV